VRVARGAVSRGRQKAPSGVPVGLLLHRVRPRRARRGDAAQPGQDAGAGVPDVRVGRAHDTVTCSLPYLNLHSLSLVGVSIALDAWLHLFRNVGRSRDLVVLLDLSGNRLDMAVVESLTRRLPRTDRYRRWACRAAA
jgi:hypothetical protein